jgi:hypothetical protein
MGDVMSDESNQQSGPVVPEGAMRVSDADRTALMERLNTACSEGRITLEEFSERAEKATVARTRDDLDALVADLPATGASTSVTPVVAGDDRTEWHVSPIGGMRRRGSWRMARKTTAVSLIGGVDLDLREAEIPAHEVVVTHVALVGGIDVTAPTGVNVAVEGFSLVGGRRVDARGPISAGSPTVRLRSFSLVGGVRVRKPRPHR